MSEVATLKVPPPPRRGILASPPAPAIEQPLENMAKPNSGIQDLNFKVDPDFHLAFKLAATMKGMSMKEVLEASFKHWVERYGDNRLRAMLPD
jgi:hypothetical protein